jgi:hypothetical protein
MPNYLDSDLNDAGVFQLIPNSTQNGHVIKVELKKTKTQQQMEKDQGTKLPFNMAVVDWEIDEGEFSGRKIRFDNIMLGGTSAEGKPISLGQLCSFLHYTGVPWICRRCNTEHNNKHSFLIATKDDSPLKPGNYYCPSCKNPNPRIGYDPDTFKEARCGLSIGSKKQDDSDKEFNIIRGYTDLV